MRRRPSLALAGVIVSLATSCAAPRASLPPVPPSVEVIMRDYQFGLSTEAIPRGRVLFRARNEGKEVHHLVLVYLPDDLPPLAEQVQQPERRVVDALVRTPFRPPGSVDRFAVNLSPGRWGLMCYVLGPDERPHAQLGMAREFKVQ